MSQPLDRVDPYLSATAEELLREAAGYQHDNHSPGDPGYAEAAELEWVYDPAYPVSRLDAPDTEWFVNEVKMAAEDGLSRDWDTMLVEPIREPIVTHENGGTGYIWDGYHRAGGSVAAGRETIPAIVGRRPSGPKF